MIKKKLKVIHLTSLSKKFEKKYFNLYAGKWCKPFFKSKNIIIHQIKNKNLAPYENDLLKFLIKKLNKYHKKNYDKKFWKFILLSWIKSFVYIVYDRFLILNKLEKVKKINYFLIAKNDLQNRVSEDFLSYTRSTDTNFFNNLIFDDLLCLKKEKKIKYFIKNRKKNLKIRSSRDLKIIIRNYLSRFSDKKILFFDTSLGIAKFYDFHLKYHFFNSSNEDLQKIETDVKFRSLDFKFFNKNNFNFKKILNILSLRYLPKSYLEGFEKNLSSGFFKKFHSTPKKVLTFHSHVTNDQFKIWYAKIKIRSKKTKLIHIQHGGHTGKKDFIGELLHNQSDQTLSWGKLKNFKKNIFLGISPNSSYKINRKKTNDILYVCTEQPMFNYGGRSLPEGPSFEKHILSQENFFKNLNKSVIQKIDIKPYFSDRGWNINKRLKNINKKFKFLHDLKMDNLFSKYNLVFCNSPGTTFLETISLNIPTIVLFSLKEWKLKSALHRELKKLKKINVFFEDPKDASNFLNVHYNDFLENWYNSKNQKILNSFRKKFALINKNYSKDLLRIIRNV